MLGDETKEQVFPMWLDGKPLKDIQEPMCTPRGVGWTFDFF